MFNTIVFFLKNLYYILIFFFNNNNKKIKMPSSVLILCQIKSKGLDGGFVNGLAKYMIESNRFKTFHYGYYKKQISFFLQDLKVNDYALICGKCVFNQDNMYVSIN